MKIASILIHFEIFTIGCVQPFDKPVDKQVAIENCRVNEPTLQGPRSKFSSGGAKEECVKENLEGGMLVDFYSISLKWRRMRITIKLLILMLLSGLKIHHD